MYAALPYLFSDDPQLSRPVDAFFEGMSGFSTTGASVVVTPESMDRSLLLWRQLSQWLGGMGIIVLALAVLPRLRIGGRQMFESELPGPEVDQLAERIRDTARRLWLHSRNRWIVLLKCYRWRTILVALPGVLLLGVAYVAFAIREGALREYVGAKSSLIRSLPHVLRERRRIAAIRRLRDRDLLAAPDLTFSPRIERTGSSSLLERGLSVVLRAWWYLARPFAG